MQRPKLTIVSNADEKFYPGLAVAVASTVAAASGAYDYHFLILDGGLSSDSLAHLSNIIDKIAEKKSMRVILEKLAIDQKRLQALPERRGSRMTYAKLLLPEILPHLDSIIYLDADILCFKGIENAMPPTAQESDWLLAGVLDFFDTLDKDCPWLDQLSATDRRQPYINCGVMWMNLEGLRQIRSTSEAVRICSGTETARNGDQTFFNFLCRGKSYLLDDKLNHRTSIGSTRPLCDGDLHLNIHYIGSPKPWLGGSKTSNWLAHQLWHQAFSALFPKEPKSISSIPPHDLASISRKALLYTILNPSRAAHYRSDLRSLKDPAKILTRAAAHWASYEP
jgi:lipopolysaccharide biosynthesis glycosyltransferase